MTPTPCEITPMVWGSLVFLNKLFLKKQKQVESLTKATPETFNTLTGTT